jgi:uncharacterized membrane protein (DUF4010 family)
MLDVIAINAGWVVALGIGLLIGAERERHKGEGPQRSAAGLRTFAIAALLGAVSIQVGGSLMLAVAAGTVTALTALAYLRDRSEDPGLTSEIALVLTVVLGGLAVHEAATAAAAAVVVAVLLAARAPMHHFVRNVLTASELKSALILAAATLVVWPVLPNRYLGPFEAINPQAIWTIAILIMAIGAGGHIATRFLGGRYGLPVAGLASGFVSSSAAIASMGARVVANPQTLSSAVAGAVLSNVATIAQAAVLLAVVSPPVLWAMGPSLAAAGATAIALGAVFTFGAAKSGASEPDADKEAFSPLSAILLALTIAAVLLLSAALRHWLGQQGLLAGAALSGLADAHASIVSVATLTASGKMSAADAQIPILATLTTNSLTKIALAIASGSRAYAKRVVPCVILVLAAAWFGAQ